VQHRVRALPLRIDESALQSSVHVGRDFEAIAQARFQRIEGIALQRGFPVPLSAGSTKKPHRFDLGSKEPHWMANQRHAFNWQLTPFGMSVE
jgi:hypothetical protein